MMYSSSPYSQFHFPTISISHSQPWSRRKQFMCFKLCTVLRSLMAFMLCPTWEWMKHPFAGVFTSQVLPTHISLRSPHGYQSYSQYYSACAQVILVVAERYVPMSTPTHLTSPQQEGAVSSHIIARRVRTVQ